MASIAVILDNILGCVNTVFTYNNTEIDEETISNRELLENGTIKIPESEVPHHEMVKIRGNTADNQMRITDKAGVPLLECPDCFCTFNDDCMPRNLPCGHTICTACALSLITSEKPCPECCQKQKISKVEELPVNYQLLRVSRSVARKYINFDTDKLSLLSTDFSKSSLTMKGLWKCVTHGSPKIFFCLSCNLWICENCRVVDHATPPRGSCTILQYTNATARIRTRYLEVSAKILKDIDAMKDNFELEYGIHDFCLKHCSEERSHLRLVKELEPVLIEKRKEYNEEVEKVTERIKKLNDSFQDSNLPEENAACCKELLSFQEELNQIIKQEGERLTIPRPSMVHHFRMEIRRLLRGKDPIYAILQENGRFQWSRMSIVDERLLLYALNEGKPPNNGIIVSYKYMEMLMAEIESKTVFLEVEADGENLSGRVFVTLVGENPLTNQMHLMCSGKKGVSYRNSRFYQKEKGWIGGGEYKKSDGSTGGTIVDGLGDCYTCSVYCSVNTTAKVIGEKHSTRFHIFLENDNEYHEDYVGSVSQGFNVIKSVAKLNSVEKSFIKDCGIFVSMKMPDRNSDSDSDTDSDTDCEE